MASLLLFGIFGVLMLISTPIAIALGLASTLALMYSGMVSSSFIAQALVTSIDSFPLMAVPFFILAGDLMGQGGLSRRLLDVGKVLFGKYSGGLAIIAVVTCIFFGAISGSGPATVAAVGGILLPAMIRDGYKPGFSTGLVASAGGLGVIIPPSIPMVIYAVSANVSVSRMFLAGVVPGMLIGLALILYAWLKSRKDGQRGMQKRYSAGEVARIIYEAKWALLVPAIILGGIYGGIFTPTEAAAVAVLYGFFVATFLYREITWKSLYGIVAGSALTSASIMIIVGAATIFGRVLTIERIPVMMADYIVSLVSEPWMLLLMVNVLLLIIGTFMETLAAIIIITPILLPIAIAFGIDPVHFGIIMIANLAIGMITPPVGINLFVGARIGQVPLEQVMKSAVPFLIIMLIVLLFITYLPAISLSLPNFLGV